MSLKDVYKSDREEKLAILPDLMQNSQIGLDMILEFCRWMALISYVYNSCRSNLWIETYKSKRKHTGSLLLGQTKMQSNRSYLTHTSLLLTAP